ncbi:MAG TPA: fibronectin type III domain-containing protein, partial [Phycisphaerales bacterium]|nr:fibronectin type III domain-containing protein [Phycisphaerales bacterium]
MPPIAALRAAMAGCIRGIVTYAGAQANPTAVFAAARLAPGASPSPSRAPGTPMNINATLDTEGNITLRWKCANPPGGNVVYSVLRRDEGTGAFVQIGRAG